MQSGPLYSDGSSLSIPQVIGAAGVAYLLARGLFANEGLALIFAILLAFIVAFTWHKRYELFQDALVIRYLWPRVTVVPFAEIGTVREAKVFPAGDGLFIGRGAKGPLFIRPRDPSQFRSRLNEWLKPLG
jgi:hypothetical protein